MGVVGLDGEVKFVVGVVECDVGGGVEVGMCGVGGLVGCSYCIGVVCCGVEVG